MRGHVFLCPEDYQEFREADFSDNAFIPFKDSTIGVQWMGSVARKTKFIRAWKCTNATYVEILNEVFAEVRKKI